MFSNRPSTGGGGLNFQTNSTQQQSYNDIILAQYQNRFKNCFSITSDNFLKYKKVEEQEQPIKENAKEIEKTIKNNTIYLDYSTNLIHQIEENYKFLCSEGREMIKYCNQLSSKNSNFKRSIDSLKRDIFEQSEFLEDDKKNIAIIEQHHYKINLPSPFFLNITEDFIEKIKYFQKTIEDYEVLFQNLFKVN